MACNGRGKSDLDRVQHGDESDLDAIFLLETRHICKVLLQYGVLTIDAVAIGEAISKKCRDTK